MSGENFESYTFEHETLQQVYDRIVGNSNKPAYPQIVPQLYYAINDINSHINSDNTNNDDEENDVDMSSKTSHKTDHNIPIVSYDEEESGAPIIHTGTKNLESLTAPIRYRIKTTKKIIEDELIKKNTVNTKLKTTVNNNVILEENEEEHGNEHSNNKDNSLVPVEEDHDAMDIDIVKEEKDNKNINDNKKKNQLPLYILLKTDVSEWDDKIEKLEKELELKKQKLKTVKERISEIIN
ncbi:hypothetical protein ACO0SA_000817 [Hanseniaspora valbyensis]